MGPTSEQIKRMRKHLRYARENLEAMAHPSHVTPRSRDWARFHLSAADDLLVEMALDKSEIDTTLDEEGNHDS